MSGDEGWEASAVRAALRAGHELDEKIKRINFDMADGEGF